MKILFVARLEAWGAILALATAVLVARPAGAELREPVLVVELHAKPANRADLRAALNAEQAPQLRRWTEQGRLKRYQLLFSRYADAGTWDALEVLTFRDDAALADWKAIERTAPGGLGPKALRAVDTLVTTPADRVRRGRGANPAAEPVVLAIPYQALVSTPDYLKYLDGYTLPQFDGWIGEGVLAGYEIVLSRYPADRPWLATILLQYRDDAALARRDEVVAKVRARLGEDPAWKAISDNKKAMRVEKTAAVADVLAAGGDAP